MRCNPPRCFAVRPRHIPTPSDIGAQISEFFNVPGTAAGSDVFIGANCSAILPPGYTDAIYSQKSSIMLGPPVRWIDHVVRVVSNTFVGPVTYAFQKNGVDVVAFTPAPAPGIYVFPPLPTSLAAGDTYTFVVRVPPLEPLANVIGSFSSTLAGVAPGIMAFSFGFIMPGVVSTTDIGIASSQSGVFPVGSAEQPYVAARAQNIQNIRLNISQNTTVAGSTTIFFQINGINVLGASIVIPPGATGTFAIPGVYPAPAYSLLGFEATVPAELAAMRGRVSFNTQDNSQGGMLNLLVPVVGNPLLADFWGPGLNSSYALNNSDPDTTIPIGLPAVSTVTAILDVAASGFVGPFTFNIMKNGVAALSVVIPPGFVGVVPLAGVLTLVAGDNINIQTLNGVADVGATAFCKLFMRFA